MSRRNKKKNNPFAAILLGPALGFVAVTALWHNEGRFDYYKAAKATMPIESLGSGEEDGTVSVTGVMDQELTLDGDYVDSFQGYLTVRRSAQIYAWDEDRDSDGDVSYHLEWSSQVESISRNDSVNQRLRSRTIAPDEYRVGDWLVEGDKLDFVDSRESIPPTDLTLSKQGNEVELSPEDGYFYLRKGQPRNLGDERLHYSGIPVSHTATYFGIIRGDRGVAHVAEVKEGFIAELIHDTGLLHHLAAGEREQALKAMKASLARLKWIVRVVGTLGTIVAYLILFSGLFSILLHIPFVNRIAEFGIMVASLILGLLTSFMTILTSYMINHPLVLVGILGVVIGIVLYSLNRRKQARASAHEALVREFGHEPSSRELAERQFTGMARVALADNQLDDKENKFLRIWAVKRGLSGDDVDRLLAFAKLETAEAKVGSEKDLTLLIQLALADQDLSPFELKKLYQAGQQLGYSRRKVMAMVTQSQHA